MPPLPLLLILQSIRLREICKKIVLIKLNFKSGTLTSSMTCQILEDEVLISFHTPFDEKSNKPDVH